MADIALIQKSKRWKKDYQTIENGKEDNFSEQEKRTFLDILSWIAYAGYSEKVDNSKLLSLTDSLNKENQTRMQNSFTSAVNSFISILDGFADRYNRNKNTWYDFYDQVKDIVGEPVIESAPETPIEVDNPTPSPNPSPTPTPSPSPLPPRPKRKKEHFSWKTLGTLILAYGGTLLLGYLPFLLIGFSMKLFDSGHWFWGIILILAGLASFTIAWYGWIAAAALFIPLWLCSTSWWLLGVIIFLVEAFIIYSMCLDTDEE